MTRAANPTRATSTGKKLEGEGSYSATRGYNEKLKRHAREQDVNKLASDARRALEGPERASLQRAEKAARKGPRAAAATKR
ncbi:MAG TPA: hypothetical protein VG937_04595 [Polyangiaceae bacterium]|jgi:hypothetical protein|nr:hypothetical protein [Polyangiaceae bacterium]